jgi:hypothetical protein
MYISAVANPSGTGQQQRRALLLKLSYLTCHCVLSDNL